MNKNYKIIKESGFKFQHFNNIKYSSIVLIFTLLLIFSFLSCGEEEYSITFNSNGGTNVSSIIGIRSGSTVTLPADPINNELGFLGWFTDNITFSNKFTSSTVISSDLTLYAKWAYNKEQLKFFYNETEYEGNIYITPMLIISFYDNVYRPTGSLRPDFIIKINETIITGDYFSMIYDNNKKYEIIFRLDSPPYNNYNINETYSITVTYSANIEKPLKYGSEQGFVVGSFKIDKNVVFEN